MRVAVKHYPFESAFGSLPVEAEVEISEEHALLLADGSEIKTLPHELVNRAHCLRQASALFYIQNYLAIFNGEKMLEPRHLEAFLEIFSVSISGLARLLGMERGSLSNILNRRRQMKSSNQFLAMERLGMELLFPTSAAKLLQGVASPYGEQLVQAASALPTQDRK